MPVLIALTNSTLLVLAALGALFVGLAIVRGPLAGAGADFEVRYRPGGRPTSVRGRVPASKVGPVREFFETDLQPSGPVTVQGNWGAPPSRSLQLKISGSLDAGQKQRIRNFLLDLLG